MHYYYQLLSIINYILVIQALILYEDKCLEVAYRVTESESSHIPNGLHCRGARLVPGQ